MLPDLISNGEIEGDRSYMIAVVATVFRDSMPWIHEIGMEAYRQRLYGDSASAQRSLQEIRSAVRLSSRPMTLEFFREDKEMYFMREELDILLHELDRDSIRMHNKIRPKPNTSK
jgi:hypothetical protein